MTTEAQLIINEIGHKTCLLKMARNPKTKQRLLAEIKELKKELEQHKGAGERG